MKAFARLCEALSRTSKKTEKIALAAQFFRDQPLDEAALAALYLSGRAFPLYTETTLQVGGTLLWKLVAEISDATSSRMEAAYRKYGDLGSAAEEVLARIDHSADMPLVEVQQRFQKISQTGRANEKSQLVRDLLLRADPIEAKYLIKIMTGDLRIGARESLVEEAIAKAFAADPAQVRRANMLLGDISETLKLAASDRLEQARMRLFHPIGMMLATPVASTEEAFSCFQHALVEDKYDGIRAQVHVDGRNVRIFSRTLDDVGDSFPELLHALKRIPESVILDGEIVAWNAGAESGQGRALPFSQLQQRLGRKSVSPELMRQVPVAYIAFDVLYARGSLQIDQPLRRRKQILDQIFSGLAAEEVYVPSPAAARQKRATQQELFAVEHSHKLDPAPILISPVLNANSPFELDEIFTAALVRGNEGLMIKDADSLYAPGRRGSAWLKLKRELATLDVVVTSVEFGHGKRAGVLSDYTFAVRAGERLLNVGKAYSGLTDAEITEMTEWFKQHTLVDHGHWRTVEPQIVLEVAFNNVMRSDRHDSGYALRFPRILRLRSDKPAAEIDTLERVREIFERQHQQPRKSA
jgi:DNA ligase-1